jgi:hypothetical protein
MQRGLDEVVHAGMLEADRDDECGRDEHGERDEEHAGAGGTASAEEQRDCDEWAELAGCADRDSCSGRPLIRPKSIS